MIGKVTTIHRKTLEVRAKIYDLVDELGDFEPQSCEDALLIYNTLVELQDMAVKLAKIDEVIL